MIYCCRRISDYLGKMILVVGLIVKLCLASFARPDLHDPRAHLHVGLQVAVADELLLAVLALEPLSLAERNVLLEVPDHLRPLLELLVRAETALVPLLVSVTKLKQLRHLVGEVHPTFLHPAVVLAECFRRSLPIVGFHEEVRGKSSVLVVILKHLWGDLNHLPVFNFNNVVGIIAGVDILVLLKDSNSLVDDCMNIIWPVALPLEADPLALEEAKDPSAFLEPLSVLQLLANQSPRTLQINTFLIFDFFIFKSNRTRKRKGLINLLKFD